MSGLVHRNNALQEKILASNILMGTGNDKTDTVEKRIEDLENGGSGGSTVEVTPLLDEGVHIADINVDGVTSALYAPEGGGVGNVNDVLVDGVSVVNQDGEAEIDLSDKQDKLVAGTNIQIGQDGKTISATDTTYSDFVGATSQQAGTHGLVPAPLVTEKDKFLKGDGTWGEAGGGNVDDVKVNGTSVVDANKVAQIVSYKEVTQAEYDALPASKNSDGIAYFIKDASLPSRPIIYSPIIYSLEERCVGVWTDGKPLYQKSFYANGSFSANTSYQITPNISGIDNILISGYLDITTALIPINFIISSSYQVYAFYDLTSNPPTILLHSTWAFTRYFITIQYTKTTDVPGSGQWAQDGIPAVHYSTDEKVIGTWFGKPLYQKTISVELSGSSNLVNQPHGISNIERVINYSGSLYAEGSSRFLPQLYNSDISYYSVSVYYVLSDVIGVVYGDWLRNNYSPYSLDVTIQYTKTTD